MKELFIQKIKVDWEEIAEESYIRQIPALRMVRELELKRPVTFFAGENGSGKSTLLEAIAIACGLNPEGGSRNYRFSTCDTHSQLYRAVTLVKGCQKERWIYFLRAESFYNVATKEKEDYGNISGYHERSHGESFLEMMQENFRGKGIFLLDEPEAALSPQRQLALMLEMFRSVKDGSQFIIASHSPILLGFPEADIFHFCDTGMRKIDYEDTDSYRITKLFLEDRDRILQKLFDAKEL